MNILQKNDHGQQGQTNIGQYANKYEGMLFGTMQDFNGKRTKEKQLESSDYESVG